MEKIVYDVIAYAGEDYDDSQEEFIRSLVEDAIYEVVNAMYPYGIDSEAEMENAQNLAIIRYRSKIKKIACFHFDKHGKEGVTRFTENGTTQVYDGSDTPKDYLRGILPVATIV